MDAGEISLPDSVNPICFPAKLWRLVNNPANTAISWDEFGEEVVIDQRRVETQVLSPRADTSDDADAFKTTNFSSFVRQLNLYGFRKSTRNAGLAGYHYFYNPNFKLKHPELVASLRRLTAHNKMKIKAGLEVKTKTPSRFRWSPSSGGGSSPMQSPTHQEFIHPHSPNKAQAVTAHSRTPVPPRFLARGHSAALTPTVFVADKGIPAFLSHQYTGVASSSKAVHIQQGLLARANHGNTNAQRLPGYYSSPCQCYHPYIVASHVGGSGLLTGSFSPNYQARYPVNTLRHVVQNQDSKEKEVQEVKKCGINLDTIFQMAEEVMPAPPNTSLVRIVTPEKPDPVLLPFSMNTMLGDHPQCSGPILLSVTGEAALVAFGQQGQGPQQSPEDAIFEVTSDDAKTSGVSETLREMSQAYNSRSTGSAHGL